ncbi:MAG TPA: UPF0175 family protein [Longimicrobium sp.]|nr:UPF0175 family protein [Longimicrobium sp.]
MSKPDPELLAKAFELYQQEKLTLGQAARLVGIGRFDFQRLLAQHGYYLTLDIDDLEQDLETLRRLGI